MALHPDTIIAILNNWDAPKYDGSQDVRPWLKAIEELCRIYGVPPIQMTEMAVKCTAGLANRVLTRVFEACIAKAGAWLWEDFKRCVIKIEDDYRQQTKDLPQDTRDGDFPSEHPYATAALAVTLIGAGMAALLPVVTVGLLAMIGLGPGGVAAGSAAIYGTGGLLSVVPSLGATMVVPSIFASFAGLGSAAAGTWLGLTSSLRED